LGQIAGFVSNFLIGAVIILVIMMVMLPRFKAPDRDQLATLVPFPPDITQLYMEKIQLMIVGMFKGTFLLAILEGLAMGLVLLVAGVPYAFLLAMVSMLLALLPMIGISLIAWPIGILLLLAGQTWQGIFVILAFVIVVANMDTALRPKLVPKGAYLNPALVMLSVFGGLSLMGFIGILYGPVIMILLVTSVEVYTKYIMRSDLEPFLAEDGSLDLEKLGLRATDAETTHDVGISLILQRIAARVSRQENTGLS
jgi:predicted PurR-regulated permease PerM